MSYQPDPLNDNSELGRYLKRELQKISDDSRTNQIEGIEFKVFHVEPDKPRTGQAYYADGSDWNPVSGGEGLYVYLSTGAWSKL